MWRIDPDTTEDFLHAAHLWATGLTTVTACTSDKHGNFWATEMFANDVVRIPFANASAQTRFGSETDTPLPGGIAMARNGGIYVTINSLTFAPGTGAVVKLTVNNHHEGGDD